MRPLNLQEPTSHIIHSRESHEHSSKISSELHITKFQLLISDSDAHQAQNPNPPPQFQALQHWLCTCILSLPLQKHASCGDAFAAQTASAHRVVTAPMRWPGELELHPEAKEASALALLLYASGPQLELQARRYLQTAVGKKESCLAARTGDMHLDCCSQLSSSQTFATHWIQRLKAKHC
jgi:hypothetical protein